MWREFNGSSKCVKEYAPSKAATSAGTTTGLQDAGKLLYCLPEDELFRIFYELKRVNEPFSWSGSKMYIHGAEEDERDNLRSLSKLFWPAAIAHLNLLRIISRCEVKDPSHSTSYSLIVARNWRMNM